MWGNMDFIIQDGGTDECNVISIFSLTHLH